MTYQEPLCGECKAASATLEVSVYRGGAVKERRLMCADCAGSFERLTFGEGPNVGLVELVDHVARQHAERAGASSRLGCPVCGMTLAETVSGGMLGCATCYVRFGPEVDEMISAAHGAVLHRGKAPVQG